LRPTVAAKLSPSGDAATQTVAFARRFVDSIIAITVQDPRLRGSLMIATGKLSRFRMSLRMSLHMFPINVPART
jgi:hypothetical protein